MRASTLQFSDRVEAVLASEELTPFVVLDLDVVAQRFRQLSAALPEAQVYYAVKANPHHEVLRLLVALGCRFDVASSGEVQAALAAGADPTQLSFGNTIKRRSAIVEAYELGVREFAVDAPAELDKLLELAPDAVATVRVLCDGTGAAWPLSKKFGCHPADAMALLRRAVDGGLRVGLSFHVGSQQRRPEAFDEAFATVTSMIDELAAEGIELEVLNAGGGFPANYGESLPDIDAYGKVIREATRPLLEGRSTRLLVEPGRYLVGDAGVMAAEVLLVSKKDESGPRWVFLDTGIFSGLFEALGEAIRYPIRTPRDGGETGPAVIAGPTCDSFDVLYHDHPYELPLALAEGDRVVLAAAGAYTAACASIGFNGFPVLRQIVLPSTEA